MKKQRERKHTRSQYRENRKRFTRVNREAEKRRERYDLCRHFDERKIYRTVQERDNDQSEPLICSDCGKRRLRIAVFLKAPADLTTETAETALTHFLG